MVGFLTLDYLIAFYPMFFLKKVDRGRFPLITWRMKIVLCEATKFLLLFLFYRHDGGFNKLNWLPHFYPSNLL
jgi:hypothetical protein